MKGKVVVEAAVSRIESVQVEVDGELLFGLPQSSLKLTHTPIIA